MRGQGGGGRTVKINPVEDVSLPQERGKVEALFDQNLFRLQLQRERSAAFWFAGSLFGMTGFIVGACLGAFIMYAAYTGLSKPVRDNIMDGFAARSAVDNAQQHAPAIPEDQR